MEMPPYESGSTQQEGSMRSIRAALLLPLLVGSSFLVSSLLRIPQYLASDTIGILLKQVGAKNESTRHAAVSERAPGETSQVSLTKHIKGDGENDMEVSPTNDAFTEKNETLVSAAKLTGASTMLHSDSSVMTNETHEAAMISLPTNSTLINQTHSESDKQTSLKTLDKSRANKTVQDSRDIAILAMINGMHAEDKPPLSSLIQDNQQKIIGDPEFLLDFAIIGFPKTGSTSMSSWIGQHSETHIANNEMFALSEGRPAGAVMSLYRLLVGSNGTDCKQGYKSPYDITNKGGALESLQTYWPKARLIIGIRHPVLWFESFVNFRKQNKANPPLDKLMKQCIAVLCVPSANFHVFLAGLGKTNATSLEGLDMEGIYAANHAKLPPPMPNKVFLYDMAQLADRNETRRAQFGRDIQKYLGLTAEMPPIVHKNEGMARQNETNHRGYIDICDYEHHKLRRELMKAARAASIWMRTYFLDSKDVYVSSREYLEEIFASWMFDPCNSTKSINRW